MLRFVKNIRRTKTVKMGEENNLGKKKLNSKHSFEDGTIILKNMLKNVTTDTIQKVFQ